MKYLSLFSGIGGFELGIQQAYENNRKLLQGKKATDIRENSTDNKSRQNGVTCIGYSEIDKYAIQVYKKHFNHKNYGDITTINPKELPDFDLIVGGFPCQSFSIAGKRGGFSDTRGTLFFDIVRIIREKQPRLLLLENVKGLLSHDQGRTFYTIISTLNEVGYDCQWQVLNSKNFGVPQNRERVFIIGHFRGTPRPKVFPIGESNKRNNESQGKTQSKGKRIRGKDSYAGALRVGGGDTKDLIASTLTKRDYKGGGNLIEITKNQSQGNRVYNPKGISTTIASQAGGQGAKTGLYMMTEKRTEEAKEIRKESMKNGKDWSPRRGKELEPRTDGKSNALTANQGKEHLLSNGAKIRRLTPTECERLQGFPDGWTEGVSDTQRYKCCGNAVTVNVIQAIMEKLLKL